MQLKEGINWKKKDKIGIGFKPNGSKPKDTRRYKKNIKEIT